MRDGEGAAPNVAQPRPNCYLAPMSKHLEPIHVIGGGLAGSEAAWQAAEAGAKVVLHEMRPTQ